MTDEAYEKKWGKGPHVTVDAVLLSDTGVYLIKRKDGPWALPGGFVEPGETLSQAMTRELLEECNVFTAREIHRRVYDKPDRDSRSHMITHVFYFHEYAGALAENGMRYIQAGDDAEDVRQFTWKEAFKMDLYADHYDIVLDAFVFWRSKK